MPWATVSITNDTGSAAWILLSHQNQTDGVQTGYWTAEAAATVGPLEVYFETGPSSLGVIDSWTVLVHIPGNTGNAGFWKSPALQCQLQSADERQSMTFAVSTSQLQVKLASGGSALGPMTRLAPGSPITNVFVVMLENHSFDNMFAMSGIPGITAATTSDSNVYDGTTYHVHAQAPLSMSTDPGTSSRMS